MEFHLGTEGGIEFKQVTGNVEQKKGYSVCGNSMNKDTRVGKGRARVGTVSEGEDPCCGPGRIWVWTGTFHALSF